MHCIGLVVPGADNRSTVEFGQSLDSDGQRPHDLHGSPVVCRIVNYVDFRWAAGGAGDDDVDRGLQFEWGDFIFGFGNHFEHPKRAAIAQKNVIIALTTKI